ncbi:hypothetical protein [Nostoc punctiforme]|uniref:Uncharacterized protein n=1 Tax=Nostoc punctiforme (strain ATCC 29133 / PCC 73102) TaxID=63737 RepID=B2J2J8_NOSP7|nr:hypothetical protein [Nostoc punctiforme]ACC80429.1 hypothetical protein Npun_F1767 [Nostoc punctiforme PCC 73102]
MKKTKFVNLSIISLIFFIFTDVFVSHSSPAYSTDNSAEPINTENTDFNCYRQYPETKYPEAKSYCHALANTRNAEFHQIWKDLTAIIKDNRKIKWEDDKIKSRLLVATWTGWNGYDDKIGKDFVTATQDIWVTVAPELQDFCKPFSMTERKKITIPYRINQLLGIPPEASEKINKRKVVQIWVDKKDLFIPTPDPEITDHEAEVNFPELSGFILITNEYKSWFLKQLMANYYPWTKLGYTYDWGKHSDWGKIDPSRPVNVGLSEFIIRENAPLKVESISSAENYCK